MKFKRQNKKFYFSFVPTLYGRYKNQILRFTSKTSEIDNQMFYVRLFINSILINDKKIEMKNYYTLFKSNLLIIIPIVLLMGIFSCNTTEPKPERNVLLNVENVSCTEAWLKLTLNNYSGSTQVELKRNGSKVNTFNIIAADTVLYDDSLSPNKTYNYQVFEKHNGIETAKSEIVNVKTVDTTSSNFTWQTYTFGGNAGSSAFYDCAIVNDTLAYAVGEVYLKDSTGQPDPLPYNFAKWNGKKWTLRKIAVNYKGVQTIAPLKGIFVLQDGKIILSSGVPYLPDGNGGWKLYQLWDMGILNHNDGSVNHIWGTSMDNLYFVGNKGTIVHYTNGSWQKIESGTNLNINDIYGVYNRETKKYEILAPASDILESLNRDLLEINGNTIEHLPTNPIEGTLSSLWFIPNRKYYVCGGGMYQKKSLNDKLWENGPFDFTKYYLYRIRGMGINDIVATGGVGELLHFNGIRWKSYINKTRLTSGNYYGLDFKNSIIIAVGENNPQAVIILGTR